MLYAPFNRFEIAFADLEEAQSAAHQGRCDEDVEALLHVPHIFAQFVALDPDDIRAELKEYGAWDEDDDQNNLRILWIAAGNVVDDRNAI